MVTLTRMCVFAAALGLAGTLTPPVWAAEAPGPEVTVTSNVAYGAAPDENGITEILRLDVYDPVEIAGVRPLVVLVHGGGFAQGDKADPTYAAVATSFVQEGYVVASVNYRLRPDEYPGYPVASLDAQHDVQAAVRWLRAHAVELRVDPSRVAVTGHSAGAITALRVAAHPDDPGISGTPGESSAVSVVLAVSGFLPGDIGSTDADVLMVHGDADTLVPVAWAEDTCARWRVAGGTCSLSSIPGGTHDPTGFMEAAWPRIAQFLGCRVGGAMAYTDLIVGAPAAGLAAWAEARGVVGTGAGATFGPSTVVSRAQFATWMWKLMGRPRRPPGYLADVAVTDKAAPAIAWAMSTGVLRERAPETFAPRRSVTHDSAAMALWRLAGKPAGAARSGLTGLDPSATHARAVDWMAGHGLTASFGQAPFRAGAPLVRTQLLGLLRGLSSNGSAWATRPATPLCFEP